MRVPGGASRATRTMARATASALIGRYRASGPTKAQATRGLSSPATRSMGRAIERVAGLLSPLVAWAFVGPLARYRPIKAEAVARAMVRVAREAPPGTRIYESEEIGRLGARP